MRFGVLRFPGSCDEVDALLACRRFADAELIWHGDRDLDGVDAVVVPGGFSYGDYLRAGAIARFSPADGGGRRVRARRAARCSASATASRCSARRACCPGALLPNDSLRFVCRQVDVEVVNADTPFTRACAAGDRLSIPVKHTTGRYYAPEATLDELEANGQVVLRYAAGPEPERLARATSPAVCNADRNVMGLMPHPEHAVDPLTGSADGGVLFASLVAHVDELVATRVSTLAPHRELGLTDAEYDGIVRAAGPRAERRSSWRCSR